MNTEEITKMAKNIGLQEGRDLGIVQGLEQGKREATIAAIHKTINLLKRMNQNDTQILYELKQDYGDTFSDEELEQFLRK